MLPPPDIVANYVDEKTGKPSKDFFNWIKSVYETIRVLPGMGAGSSVTQSGAIGNAVTINALSGKIATVSNAWVASSAEFFTVNNSKIAANDTIVLSQYATGANAYNIFAFNITAGSFVLVILPFLNATEDIGINFAIIKAVNS